MKVSLTIQDWLRHSLRCGLLFGRADEPLDDYGKRIVRVILEELDLSARGTDAGPRAKESTS